MELNDLPTEVLCSIASTINTDVLKCLMCVCNRFRQVFSDSYITDLYGIKLYDHQRQAVKFILEQEANKRNTLLNLDTGTGKTAVVLYTYLKNPIPTAIVLKKKHIIIWGKELVKYNVNLNSHIYTVSQACKCDMSAYKRFIMDEVHEKLFTGTEQSDKFLSITKHGTIIGLSADSGLISASGSFTYVQLDRLFGDPSNMITVRINQLDTEVRSKFKLPNFNIINSLDYFMDVKDKGAYIIISDYLQNVESKLIIYGLHNCKFTKDVHNWIQQTTTLRCRYVDPHGVINLEGVKYYDFLISEWIGVYHRYKVFDFKEEIIKLIKGKRAIIYGYGFRSSLMRELGYDLYAKYSNPKLCGLFMGNVINTLILPSSYSAGYNFGHIDVVIIHRCAGDYPTFKQIMGRINRLDQQNNTEVYILHTPADCINPQSLINQYKNEFVE